MSLISYNELCELVEQGVIAGVDPSRINSASIDLTLGNKLLNEGSNPRIKFKSLSKKEKLDMYEWDLEQGAYLLHPGEFVLAHTVERFYLPDYISAEYKLKSSMARLGLEHLNAGWCDAGWHGSVLTLELKNMTRSHCIELNHKDPIGQIVFFKHDPVPKDKSYAARGRYNHDLSVSGVKKDGHKTSKSETQFAGTEGQGIQVSQEDLESRN